MQFFKKNFISFVLILVFFVFLFNITQNSSRLSQTSPDKVDKLLKTELSTKLKIAGQNIKVELAVTDSERQKGLSGRKVLEENKGMLFVFEKSDLHTFWMQDMNFPIDIIWFDQDLKVVYIKKDALPELFPEIYGPEVHTKYVLEINAGWVEKNNLQLGDTAIFIY